MTTALAICTKALRKCHEFTVLPSDALTNPVGKIASVCAEFYEPARRAVLRLAPWTCIAKRVALAHQNSARLTEYAVGDLVIGTHTSIVSVYKCTTAGTSAAGAPSWPASSTVSDGTVVWTFQYDVQADLLAEHFTGYEYQYAVPKDYINQIGFFDTEGTDVDGLIEGQHLFAHSDELVLYYVPDETDTTKWDSLLDLAMITQLAAMIAYPISGSHENEAKFTAEAGGIIAGAQVMTQRERKQGAPRDEEWAPGLFDNQRRTS